MLGFDVAHAVVNNAVFDKMKQVSSVPILQDITSETWYLF